MGTKFKKRERVCWVGLADLSTDDIIWRVIEFTDDRRWSLMKPMQKTGPSCSDGELPLWNKLTQTQMNGVSPPTLWHSEDRDFPCLQHRTRTRTYTHTIPGTHREKGHPWLTHTRSGQSHGWSDRAATNTHRSIHIHKHTTTHTHEPRSVQPVPTKSPQQSSDEAAICDHDTALTHTVWTSSHT